MVNGIQPAVYAVSCRDDMLLRSSMMFPPYIVR